MKVLIGLFISVISLYSNNLDKKYYEIRDIQKMKKDFFSFMKNISDIENKKIYNDRLYIIEHFENRDKRFNKIKKRYSLKDNSTLREYLYVIDVIPTSLVLSQAAVESGWGKSRFFIKAKNIFGQWTWTGKGLNPIDRDSDKKHKIKIFNSLQTSVKAYLINLNKGWGYKELRDIRQMLRDKKQTLSGYVMAKGLINYSQKREKYIKLLKNLIKSNQLYIYDTM